MRRIVAVVGAVLVAVLVVAAPAAGAHTAVVSIHTTDTDFNNAATLDEVAVEGSGDSANVALEQEATGTTASRDNDDSSTSSTNRAGLEINPNTNLEGVEIDISSNTNGATVAYLQASDGTVLDSTSISGGSAGLYADLASGTDYYVTVDDNGNSYTVGFDGSPSFPYSSTDVDITAGADNAQSGTPDTTSTSAFNVKNVTAVTEAPLPGTYISSNHSVSDPVDGFTDLSLSNAEATVTWQGASGGSWTDIQTNTYTTTGNKSVSLPNTHSEYRVNVTFERTSGTTTAELHDEGITASTSPTVLDDSSASPSGGETLSESPTFSINGTDADFGTSQGDTVTLTWFRNGNQLGTTTETSNGTWTFTPSDSVGGDNTWNVSASDSYGHTTQSDSNASKAGNQPFEYTAPGNLFIREESEDHPKITSATVTVKFFEDAENNQTIVQRTSSDGSVSLAGLPADSQFVADVEAPGYKNRTVIIDSLYEQQTVFLVETSVDSVENRFTVSDRTGNFPAEDTELVIQKAINRSLYGETPAEYTWTNIAGDDLGADEALTTDLIHEDRYRIIVRNDGGDTRVLGAYSADTAGTIELKIGSVVVDPEAPDVPGFSANRTNATGQPVRVNVQYNDTTSNTSTIYVHVYEYGNESNVLVANTSFTGTYGVFTYTKDVPSVQNDTEWVVEFTAKRSPGSDIHFEQVVGGQKDVLPDAPPWLITFGFVGLIWITAGLFSQLNGHLGGLVVAGMGGMFWFVGFVPPMLGSGVVALSMMTAGVLFLRERNRGF